MAGGGYQVEGPSRYGGVQLVTNVVPEQPSGVLKGGLKVPLGKYNVYAVLVSLWVVSCQPIYTEIVQLIRQLYSTTNLSRLEDTDLMGNAVYYSDPRIILGYCPCRF